MRRFGVVLVLAVAAVGLSSCQLGVKLWDRCAGPVPPVYDYAPVDWGVAHYTGGRGVPPSVDIHYVVKCQLHINPRGGPGYSWQPVMTVKEFAALARGEKVDIAPFPDPGCWNYPGWIHRYTYEDYSEEVICDYAGFRHVKRYNFGSLDLPDWWTASERL